MRIVVATLLLAGATACAGGGTPASDSSPTFSPEGHAAAEHFLARYVTDDGRVLRRDQGSDVVSEGQAYGMLIAELVDDAATVRRIWSWTSEHLRRADGLLSYHADASGRVLDRESATDADTLAAYALLRYDGSGASDLHRDGRQLAAAVLAHETATVGSSGLVALAGSWVHGEPAWVNPSYWMPGVDIELARLTGDDRWSTVAATAPRLVAGITGDGRTLPPDWAQLHGTTAKATGAPDGSRQVQYGPDAQRVPVFFAAACEDGAVRLASAWWRTLQDHQRSGALALGVDGRVVDPTPAPLAYLAAATAARAAGDDRRAAALVGSATDRTRSAPTYYGDAWLALAAGLAEQRFGTC